MLFTILAIVFGIAALFTLVFTVKKAGENKNKFPVNWFVVFAICALATAICITIAKNGWL